MFAATGRSPVAADSAPAALFRVVQSEPDLAGVPPQVLGLVRACLDRDPRRRPTAQQIAVGLRGGGPVPAPPLRDPRPTAQLSTLPAIPAASRRWGRVVAAAVGAVVVAAAAVMAVVFLKPGPGADPTGGTPPASGTPTPSAAPLDPTSEQARYVDRLCASGDLLLGLGKSTTVPQPTGDPVVAKRDFLTSMDRVIAVSDAGLADFAALRDDAPDAALRLGFGQVVEEFTSARGSFGDARAAVAATEPLTADAYRDGVEGFADGARNLALAAQIVQGLTLPQDYKDAYPSAQHCTD